MTHHKDCPMAPGYSPRAVWDIPVCTCPVEHLDDCDSVECRGECMALPNDPHFLRDITPDRAPLVPVEPYTVEEALELSEMSAYADAGGRSVYLTEPRMTATLRAYAAQGKRIEELELAALHHADDLERAARICAEHHGEREKAEAALKEAVGLLRRLQSATLDVRGNEAEVTLTHAEICKFHLKHGAFLAKQASK